MKQFEYHEVDSSNIAQVGYDKEALLLEILFKGGGKYWYLQVPSDVVDNLLTADSVGKYFHAHIKKDAPYPYIKVTDYKQDAVFDAALMINSQRVGGGDYYKFSELCEVMGWDFLEAWEQAHYRFLWLEYQDREYMNAVLVLADSFKGAPVSAWPMIVEEMA